MRALCWYGRKDVRVEDVPMPRIVNPHDAIVKVTLTASCGSDLHLYDGYIPSMQTGDVLGHEFMGEVVEVGREVPDLAIGDRVVVPFTISCGRCFYCERQLWSLCGNTNPNAKLQETAYGHAGAGIYGYSHMLGGYAGGQAEYVRVPFADVGPIKVPAGIPDETALFLSDIFPTGWQAAEQCDIHQGDTVAVWGCGPVGQFAIRAALLLGAERVIAIDHYPRRLRMAAQVEGVVTLDFDEERIYEQLLEITAGRGPDACIDAVGLEAHGVTPDALYDRVKTASMMATDRPRAVDPRRLRRARGQVPDRGDLREGADDQDRADARAALPAAPPVADRVGRDRSGLRDHPPRTALAGRRHVRPVLAPQGRLRQGGDAPVTPTPVSAATRSRARSAGPARGSPRSASGSRPRACPR